MKICRSWLGEIISPGHPIGIVTPHPMFACVIVGVDGQRGESDIINLNAFVLTVLSIVNHG